MVDGEDKTRVQPLRPSAPLDGPLEGSGAAPDPVPRAVPRPRRPWLSGKAPAAPNPTAGAPKTDAPDGGTKADAPGQGTKTDATGGGTNADAPADDLTAAPPAVDSDAVTAPAGAGAETPAGDAKTTPLPAAEADPKPASVDDVASAPKIDPGRRRRVPFAHALRLPPRQAAATAARATRAWARRPSGRLTLPGVFLLALVAATAAAGALLVPAAIRAPRPVAVDASDTPAAAVPPPVLPSGVPTGPLPTGPLPTGGLPTGALPTGPAGGPVTGGRPSDALAGWAQQVGTKVGVPPAAMQAYGYAELVLAQTNRSCALSWTTLAAIGQVESGHGTANGARLGPDGKALPQIIGLPLDGRDGRMRIIDTDRGNLDQDTSFDRAIGPMQFIPTTWQEIGADADNDGVKDPHDLDDAALAAGNYLCKNNRNLSIAADWWNAILSYNDVRRYAQDVYDTANRYGRASRT
ncbi:MULTISPECIES: lytic transglycosylase domain-containing protein [unclassified Micromonospora]|uniref:lytic transglycosylase domain-containing protein n=1 Tax=unclassified Micromonospora TaxID=2617518 RepID=UPI0033A2625D